MYEEALRMPFLVRWPAAIKPGTRSRALALNVDFAPTFLEAAGVPVPADMQGRSLLPILRGRTPADWRTSMYYRYYHDPGDHNTRAHYGVRTATHKLIYFWKKDQWELFDLVNDPHELHNLYGLPGHEAVTAELKTELLRLKKSLKDDDQFANDQLPNGVDGPVATLRGQVDRVNDERLAVNRRRFFECLSAIGLGSTLMPDALTIAAQDSDTITIEMIEAAQTIAGISFTREEQQAIATRLNATRGYLAGFRFLKTANLGNDTQPAIVFNPVPPGKTLPAGPRGLKRREPLVSKPSSDEALAFLPVTHLAKLVKSRQVKPSELTELYLSRLTAHDPDTPLRRQPHGGSRRGRRRSRPTPRSPPAGIAVRCMGFPSG